MWVTLSLLGAVMSKKKLFFILYSNRISMQNLTLFWHNKTQKERVSTESKTSDEFKDQTRNTGLKTLFYNSFYLWLFKRHLISDKSETRGWCSCISSELIPGNHSKSQSQIRGFPLSKNSGWPAIKLSLVNRWQSLSEILVTHSLLLEPFFCMRQKLPFFLFTVAVRASTTCKVNEK